MSKLSENPWRMDGVDGQDDASVREFVAFAASISICDGFSARSRCVVLTEGPDTRLLPLLAKSRPFRLFNVV